MNDLRSSTRTLFPLLSHRLLSSFCPWATYWTIPPFDEAFVEPLLFAFSVACTLLIDASEHPCDDIEKSRHAQISLHFAMPLSGNFAIQAKSVLKSSLNLHFLFGAIFSTGASVTRGTSLTVAVLMLPAGGVNKINSR